MIGHKRGFNLTFSSNYIHTSTRNKPFAHRRDSRRFGAGAGRPESQDGRGRRPRRPRGSHRSRVRRAADRYRTPVTVWWPRLPQATWVDEVDREHLRIPPRRAAARHYLRISLRTTAFTGGASGRPLKITFLSSNIINGLPCLPPPNPPPSAAAKSNVNIQIYNTLSTPEGTVRAGRRRARSASTCAGRPSTSRSHIGHMVGPVIFDTIKRYLVYCGYDVTLGGQHHRRRRQADRRGERARHPDGRGGRRRMTADYMRQPRGAGRRSDRPHAPGDREHGRDHRLHRRR